MSANFSRCVVQTARVARYRLVSENLQQENGVTSPSRKFTWTDVNAAGEVDAREVFFPSTRTRNSIGCSAHYRYAHTRACTKITVSNNSPELYVCDVSTGKQASKFRPVSMQFRRHRNGIASTMLSWSTYRYSLRGWSLHRQDGCRFGWYTLPRKNNEFDSNNLECEIDFAFRIHNKFSEIR